MPHFEVAGAQMDWEYRKRATQIAVSVAGIVTVVAIAFTLVLMLPQANKAKKTTFGQMQRSNTPVIEKHRNKVLLRIHSMNRETEVRGQFFLQNKARDGFSFVLIDLTITNKSGVRFPVNPFDFRLYNKDGSQYRAALATKSHPEGIEGKSLSPNASLRGILVFQVPQSARPDSLELMGASDAIATVQL